MEMTFTPGPWKWIPGEKPTHEELVSADEDGQGSDSILYHGADWPMKECDKFKLFAAPDMYKALKIARDRLINQHADLVRDERANIHFIRTDETILSIAAALAKAEGRTA